MLGGQLETSNWRNRLEIVFSIPRSRKPIQKKCENSAVQFPCRGSSYVFMQPVQFAALWEHLFKNRREGWARTVILHARFLLTGKKALKTCHK